MQTEFSGTKLFSACVRRRTDYLRDCGPSLSWLEWIMTKSLANFRDLGSFIAGLLVGLSIVVPVFAMIDSDPGDGQALWFFVAPIILALGIMLQVLASNKPRSRRTLNAEPGASPIRLVVLSHER